MSDGIIILPTDAANTGKKLDSSVVTVGANTVYRERINIADPTSNNFATVLASGAVLVEPGGVNVQTVTGSGSAGTPAAGVVTVQGITSGTAVPITGHAGGAFDAATAATAPANAIQVGLLAATQYPTAVTNGQLVGGMSDKAGRAAVVLNCPRDISACTFVQSTSSATTTLVGAGSTGVFRDFSELILTNESSTATIASLSDGTITYKFALAGNGGGVFPFLTPLKATSSATQWTLSNSAAVNVDAVVIYINNQ
jgi:hypothetical protein